MDQYPVSCVKADREDDVILWSKKHEDQNYGFS